MAVKKAAKDAAEIESVETETVAEAPAKAKASAKKAEAFCVYIGPTIKGVIQSGTVFRGTREMTLQYLSGAVAKYPLIAALVVTEKTIAEDRIKVKTAGNLLNVQYRKLAKKEEN